MKIAVIGTGYVGLVSAACFAELGHHVVGVDINAEKIRMLKTGKSPIFEPGLEELIQRGLKSERLSFTTDIVEALPSVEIVFSAVATPQGEDHKADLKAVFAVAETIAKHIDHDIVFVNKSTVPVGTGRKVEERIAQILKDRGSNVTVTVVSNPEFLREGMAVGDTLMPDRIVVGINSPSPTPPPLGEGPGVGVREKMEELYRPITRVGKPLLFMSRESAEIVKYASNSFLATKISFINMLTEFCEKTGANIRDVAKGMGLDDRIGPRFLHAGIGYGGSCFPKDVKALMATAKEYDLDLAIIQATDQINTGVRHRFFQKIFDVMLRDALPPVRLRDGPPVRLRSTERSEVRLEADGGPPQSDKQHDITVAVWGLAFKPKTDDMREAPSLDLIPLLLEKGFNVRAYDPAAMENAKKLLSKEVTFANSPLEAAKNADAVVLLTEWDEFRGIDLKELKDVMKGADVFDGRNVYEPGEVVEIGLKYHGIGIA